MFINLKLTLFLEVLDFSRLSNIFNHTITIMTFYILITKEEEILRMIINKLYNAILMILKQRIDNMQKDKIFGLEKNLIMCGLML